MLIIAHRGASAEAPENTLAAVNRALDAHADGIEIDVYEIDGEIFVFHDRYLERLTTQPGRLTDLTAAQVRMLKIFGQYPVPTLQDVLACVAGRCLLNIELKGEVELTNLCQLLDDAISTYSFSQQQIIVSSFNHHWLRDIKQHRSWVQTGALSASCMLDYAAFASQVGAYSVHVSVDVVNQALVNDCHQRGMPVYVYTVDHAEDIHWLNKMGVDGVFTNHPQHTRNILSSLPVSQSEMLWHR